MFPVRNSSITAVVKIPGNRLTTQLRIEDNILYYMLTLEVLTSHISGKPGKFRVNHHNYCHLAVRYNFLVVVAQSAVGSSQPHTLSV